MRPALHAPSLVVILSDRAGATRLSGSRRIPRERPPPGGFRAFHPHSGPRSNCSLGAKSEGNCATEEESEAPRPNPVPIAREFRVMGWERVSFALLHQGVFPKTSLHALQQKFLLTAKIPKLKRALLCSWHSRPRLCAVSGSPCPQQAVLKPPNCPQSRVSGTDGSR